MQSKLPKLTKTATTIIFSLDEKDHQLKDRSYSRSRDASTNMDEDSALPPLGTTSSTPVSVEIKSWEYLTAPSYELPGMINPKR